ncbi:MAG: Bax inhibitor-1/YccA family membrane protein [Acholeplasmataceae bacterium]|jgi:uncharacterized YccA/Bax inhibitor family protein
MRQSSNPVFKSLAKQQVITVDAATITGVSFKSILLLVLTLASAAVSVLFGIKTVGVTGDVEFHLAPWLVAVIIASGLTSFISVMLATFFPRVAMPFSILYSLGQGAVLGTLTAIVNFFIPGAALTALIGVTSIFLVMLFLYMSRTFRVTNKFRRMMFAGLIAILLTSLISGILSIVAPQLRIFNNLPLAIILSVVLIIFGAFMLMLDFDYAESIVEAGFPKRYEWVAALGLMVTLVWIYVQVLRLIILLASRRD